jgi:heptosyltransferase-3
MNYGDYIDIKNIKKILVVKLRHLGDVLLTTPIFFNLKKYIKTAQVDVFIYEDSYEVLKNNPYVNEIFTYDKNIKKLSFFKRLKREIKILKEIRKRRYDLVINLTEGDRGAIIAYFSKARYKIGFDPEKKGFFKKEKIYSHLIKNPKTKRHTVEKNLDALRRVGIFPKKDDKELFFQITNQAEKNIKFLLAENHIPLNEYILIHPTTRWRFKCWDKFDQLIRYFHEKKQKIVVVSGKASYEIDMVNEITKDTAVLNLAGKVVIDELAVLITYSKIFYCLDSFCFHLANALKAKTVGFFGPSCDITWGIWNNINAKIIKANIACRPCSLDGCGGSKVSECMREITLEDLNLDYIQNSSPK